MSIIDGVKSSKIIDVVSKIPLEKRFKVKEVSVDMANNMEKAAKTCFPNEKIITDRFHVAKLVSDAVQSVRVGQRWDALDKESEEIKQSKEDGHKYIAKEYSNGDTEKQLLARSRYLLFKSKSKWSKSQKVRGKILFEEFPSIEKGYKLSMMLRNIYKNSESRICAEESYQKWKIKVLKEIEIEESQHKNQSNIKTRRGMNVFETVMNSIEIHKENIMNFFENRTTNAMAECFNSKLKAFRSTFRGIRDFDFFLYRISKIFS